MRLSSRVVSLGALLTSLVGACATPASAVTLWSDYMNRATFDAPNNDWIIQSYNKSNSKGTYGRIPGAVDSNSAFRYGVQSYSTTNIVETNTIVAMKDPTDPLQKRMIPRTFSPPTTAGQYLEFAAAIKINWSSANQHGLVFGMSAYTATPSGAEDAINMEFVTEQLNTGTATTTAYDRIDLTSFNDFSGSAANKWYQQKESGVNSTDAYHAYAMRLYNNKVDYLVDGNVFATTTSVVPAGTPLKFVFVAWAPDATWPSAESLLPSTGFWYMDISWVTVSSGSTSGLMAVPEPGCGALLAACGGLVLRRRR